MSWNYAELSKAAKAAGGPEALMEKVTEDAKQEGRAEMTPAIFIAGVVGSFLGWGVPKVVTFVKDHFGKKKSSPEEIAAAKAEIIQGIKDYDAAQEKERQSDTDNSQVRAEENDDEKEDEDGTV